MIVEIVDLNDRVSTRHMSVIENDLKIEAVVKYMTGFTVG